MIATGKVKPAELRVIPRDLLTHRNTLCKLRQAVKVNWQGTSWQAQLVPSQHPPAALLTVELDWGGARAGIGMPASQVASINQEHLLEGTAQALPEDILLALLEHHLDGLRQVVETNTRKPVRILSANAGAPEPDREAFSWVARSGDQELVADMHLDSVAMRYLASALRAVPLHSGDEAAWDELPCPVRLLAGWVDLKVAELGALEPHDVLLMDECFVSGSRLAIHLGGKVGLIGEIDGQSIKVIEGVQEIMADHESESVEDGQDLIDELPIRLTFDLGERSIPLGELRTLQKGYLFNLGRDPRSAVSIRANGRLIGEGELVDIEGRIGVSLLSITPQSP